MMHRFLGGAVLAIVAACGEPAATPDGGAQAAQLTRPELTPAPDAASLPRALREGTAEPVQVVGSYLKRIELLDDSGPRLQAVIRVNPEAVSDARALQAARRSGEEPGPLYGLPILVKDNIETRGMPTTAGSLALAANDTARDAPAIERLREAGAIILGKTNLSEWANFRSSQSVSGWSGVGGQTLNPHDLSRNPCGSSSGSGAAVAAGLAWAALGTETNGSVTCPAAVNGIVGFKPTVGLVSRQHVVPISPSQDTIGPMTTSVRDAAMVLGTMAGTDPGDEATADADAHLTDFVAALDDATLEGVRLGVLRWATAADPREKAVFEEALVRAEAAGAILVDIDEWDGELSGEDSFNVLKAEFKDALNAYLAEAAPEVETRTLADVIAFNEGSERELALFGQDILAASEEMPGTGDKAYREALARVRKATREDGIDFLLEDHEVDFLVAPTFGPAFLIDPVRGDVFGESAGAGWLAAIAGYPHLTLPMGDVRGLPVGFSIMGGKWQDAAVLRAGHALERELPPRTVPMFRTNAASDPMIEGALRPGL